jgi:hypothetical protein
VIRATCGQVSRGGFLVRLAYEQLQKIPLRNAGKKEKRGFE